MGYPRFVEFERSDERRLFPYRRAKRTRIFRQHSRMYRSVRSRRGRRDGSSVSVAVRRRLRSAAISAMRARTFFSFDGRQSLQRYDPQNKHL